MDDYRSLDEVCKKNVQAILSKILDREELSVQTVSDINEALEWSRGVIPKKYWIKSVKLIKPDDVVKEAVKELTIKLKHPKE